MLITHRESLPGSDCDAIGPLLTWRERRSAKSWNSSSRPPLLNSGRGRPQRFVIHAKVTLQFPTPDGRDLDGSRGLGAP